MNLNLRKLTGLFMLGCILLTGTTVNAAESEYQYTTVYGNKYKYNSAVNADSTSVWAHVTIATNEMKNLPAGYFGGNARLFDSAGTLLKMSGWGYNETELGGMSFMSGIYYGKGSYYGKGQVRMFNGDEYISYITNPTPIIQSKVAPANIICSTNENGETYGSEYFLNTIAIEPDLIQAQGVNGATGYVKATDLNDDYIPASPAEAVIYQNSLPSNQEIPLYNNDGETVIDTFIIDYGNTQAINN